MRMVALLVITTSLLVSCRSSLQKIFEKKTPHQEYANKLESRGLDDTPEGRLWLSASNKALAEPQTITLPHRLQGFFHVDKPRALGLKFLVNRGERINFILTKKLGSPLPIYADVFKLNGTNAATVLSVDTSKAEFYFDADEAGEYLLRLQPELFRSGEYNLSVSVGPSLDFPVSGSKAHVGSFWGADREGGRRSHEGIDIFAPRLTPVVAAADGYVVGVREGGLGGKTVWLRPANRAVTLYYAHLDRQLVQEGESVKKGDVIGLVGNTGNAQATAPHLHFGIYTANGPVDPLPFVNTKVKTAPPVPEKNLVYKVRLKKPLKTASGEQIQMNTTLVPLATTSKGYLLEAPGGAVVLAPFSSVKSTQDRVANPSPVELANQGGGSNKF